MYCGAFQWLHNKQLYIDNLKNEGGKNKSEELKDLLDLSRNLLCEIETAMGVKPKVLNEKAMQARLKFNNHQSETSSQEVYDIDNQFAKDRFTKYLLNMQIEKSLIWKLTRLDRCLIVLIFKSKIFRKLIRSTMFLITEMLD